MSRAARIQPAPTIFVEMSETEAEVLCALLGGVRGSNEVTAALFQELDGLLPNRAVAFCDFFTGDVRSK